MASSIADGDAFVEGWDVATGTALVSAVVADGVLAVASADDGAITVATPDGIVRLAADGRDEVLATARWGQPQAIAGSRVAYGRAGAFAVVDLATCRACAEPRADRAKPRADRAEPRAAHRRRLAPLVSAAAFDCDARATAALSPDGARLAIVTGDRVALHDVPGGVAEAAAPRGFMTRGAASRRERERAGRHRAPARPGPRDRVDAWHGAILATADALVLWDPVAGTAAAIATPVSVTAIGLGTDATRPDAVALGFADGRAGVWSRASLRALAHPTALVAAGAPRGALPRRTARRYRRRFAQPPRAAPAAAVITSQALPRAGWTRKLLAPMRRGTDIAEAARVLARRRAGRVPDRDRVRARRRCVARRRGREDLRRQGPAARASADRPPRAPSARLDDWAADVPDAARRLAARRVARPADDDPARAARASRTRSTGGADTVGLRVPAHPVAQALLARVRRRHRGAEREPVRRGQPDDRRSRRRAISATTSTTCSTAARARSASSRRSSICRAAAPVLLRPGGLRARGDRGDRRPARRRRCRRARRAGHARDATTRRAPR